LLVQGGWWDPLTITWATILKSETRNTPPVEGPSPGASLYIPFSVGAGETKMIRLMLAWYVPETDLKYGQDPEKPIVKPALIQHVHVRIRFTNHGIRESSEV
jgi:hypothetical protein